MTTKNSTYHKSVLVQEVLEYLKPEPNKVYLDVTFGGGGHTKAILDHEPTCRVVAFDWDKDAIETQAPKLQEQYGNRLKVIWGNFAHMNKLLHKEKINSLDGILADFGTSQHQLLEKEGFSFRGDSPLDMRMSPAHQRMTAADIINHYSEKRLANVIFDYGEEPRSRKIAKAIVEARKTEKFKTTNQLTTLIESVLLPGQTKRNHKVHIATKTFQALRIEVNQELTNITHFLKASLGMLKKNGRLVCISFHSLEDRLVKNFFRENKHLIDILTNKPVIPTDEEITQNPSSRSSKLRAASKL